MVAVKQKKNEMNNWLITGGCGFIGTSLVKRLLREGDHYIRVFDNLSAGTREDLCRICNYRELTLDMLPSVVCHPPPGTVDLVIGDVRNADSCIQAAWGMDIIVHLAANTGVEPSIKDPRHDLEANVFGTFNMLDAARMSKVKRFVFASSGAPVGECTPPIHEELAPHPVSPYGASKLAGEGYCSAFYRAFGLETVSLRFGNVYGPGSGHKSSVVARFIRQAMRDETCEIYGDGGQTRDFIYIDDLIEAIVLSASRNVAGETFQIATSTERTVNEVAETIRSVLNEHDIPMAIEYSEPRTGDVQRNFSDTSKALNLLGWKVGTGFTDGIRKTVSWFLDQNTEDRGQRTGCDR